MTPPLGAAVPLLGSETRRDSDRLTPLSDASGIAPPCADLPLRSPAHRLWETSFSPPFLCVYWWLHAAALTGPEVMGCLRPLAATLSSPGMRVCAHCPRRLPSWCGCTSQASLSVWKPHLKVHTAVPPPEEGGHTAVPTRDPRPPGERLGRGGVLGPSRSPPTSSLSPPRRDQEGTG